MKFLIVAACALLISGCWQSRSDTTQNVIHHDHLAIDGTLTLPGPTGAMPVPVHLVVDHDGTDETTAHVEKSASIDGAAVGREIAAAIGPLMAAGTAGTPWGIVGAIGSAATALGAGYVAHKARQHGKAKPA